MSNSKRINEIKKEIADIKNTLSEYSLEVLEDCNLSSNLTDVIVWIAFKKTAVLDADELYKWKENCSRFDEYMKRVKAEFKPCNNHIGELKNAHVVSILDVLNREQDKIKEIIRLTKELN